MIGITKRFDGFAANENISFDIKNKEIHSLLGENGAGKTTLMKILYGLIKQDLGDIIIAGKKVEMKSPRDAIQIGIGMVHQHFMLISQHTVLENIILGMSCPPFEPREAPKNLEKKIENFPFKLIDRVKMYSNEHADKILEISNKYGLNVNLSAKIWQLSVGERQRVEIIKALYRGAKILILDEPSSNLTPIENENFLLVLRTMVERGITVVLITHHMSEAISVSDRVTVLRDGKRIATLNKDELSEESLARMVVGRDIAYSKAARLSVGAEKVLRVENIWAKNDLGVISLMEVFLDVYKGEILGLAGVEGNGQRELVEVIMGLRKAEQGRVIINGSDITGNSTREILDKAVSYIPQDRNTEGLIADFDISENLIVNQYDRPIFSNWLFTNAKKIRENAVSLIKGYDIRCRGPRTKVRTLSGGNAQRVIIARELSRDPILIVASQPTRGLDIASTEFVLNKLAEHRERGCAILLFSTELDQLLRVSDRIAVIYDGRIQGIIDPKKTEIQQIGLLMLGKNKK